jgi:hypothetical protein
MKGTGWAALLAIATDVTRFSRSADLKRSTSQQYAFPPHGPCLGLNPELSERVDYGPVNPCTSMQTQV